MSQGNESDAGAEWLDATLRGDTTLGSLGITGVHQDVAPEGAAFPYVVYSQQAASDVMVVGAYRIFSRLLFLVKVVGQTASYAALASAAARIDQLLHRGSGTSSNGTTWGCLREQAFRLAEVENGIQYRSSGGLYRLYVT